MAGEDDFELIIAEYLQEILILILILILNKDNIVKLRTSQIYDLWIMTKIILCSIINRGNWALILQDCPDLICANVNLASFTVKNNYI